MRPYLLSMETPNLTLDLCGGKVATRDGVAKERYKSLEECAAKRHIPTKVLSAAKNSEPLPHHGFQTNCHIKWDELQPWLSANYTTFLSNTLSPDNDEIAALEKRKLTAEVVKLENFNKERSRDYISRKLVLKTMHTLYGNLFAHYQRYLEQEQPQQCAGMTPLQLKQHNREFMIREFASLKNQENLWAACADISTVTEGATSNEPS